MNCPEQIGAGHIETGRKFLDAGWLSSAVSSAGLPAACNRWSRQLTSSPGGAGRFLHLLSFVDDEDGSHQALADVSGLGGRSALNPPQRLLGLRLRPYISPSSR